MFKQYFNLRKVAAIVACLAVTMTFASCEPEEDDPIDPSAPAFTAFSIGGQSASINVQDKTVTITVACGTNIAALMPEFTLSPEGATATANGKTQTSGTTAVNCSEPVTYTLTTADGTATAEWTVTVKLPDDCPTAKKYITYNKPVTAYFIEYNGGAVEANQDPGRWGTSHPVIEAYENKKYAWVSFVESRFECNITYPDGSWCFNWECAYGGITCPKCSPSNLICTCQWGRRMK
jgi:hypothetical protein